MDDLLELPPPQYLGRRRQSTLEEIAAFAEKISFKKEEEIEESPDADVQDVSRIHYWIKVLQIWNALKHKEYHKTLDNRVSLVVTET